MWYLSWRRLRGCDWNGAVRLWGIGSAPKFKPTFISFISLQLLCSVHVRILRLCCVCVSSSSSASSARFDTTVYLRHGAIFYSPIKSYQLQFKTISPERRVSRLAALLTPSPPYFFIMSLFFLAANWALHNFCAPSEFTIKLHFKINPDLTLLCSLSLWVQSRCLFIKLVKLQEYFSSSRHI